jgi:TnsA-like endonuclease N terminal
MSAVSALGVAPKAGAGLSLDLVEIGYAAEDGTEQRVSLVDAPRVSFEWCAPVRRFLSRKGQRHLSGRWWSATVAGHVGYESWLERDHLMWLDYDPDVVAIASQPFWLYWTTAEGTARAHAPDFFARRADGSAVVIDCRPDGRIKPRDAAAFAATERVCELLGWEFRRVGAPDAVTTGNVRWLSGYRHPRHDRTALAAVLRELFAAPAPLMAAAEAAGDPIAVLPVLFHLLWRRELAVDLTVALHPSAEVTVRAAVSAAAA